MRLRDKLLIHLEPVAVDGLREAQRAWVNFRDAACGASGNIEAGNGIAARLVSSGCRLLQTALRTAELERFVRR